MAQKVPVIGVYDHQRRAFVASFSDLLTLGQQDDAVQRTLAETGVQDYSLVPVLEWPRYHGER